MPTAAYNQQAFFSRTSENMPCYNLSLDKRRLVVVSNRLPVSFKKDSQARLSSGGLVTAMVPVLNKWGGLWIGWPGTSGDMKQELDIFAENQAYNLCPVSLSQEDMTGFYNGFANQVLWPLFHGFPTKCVYDSWFWECYDRVNQNFARTVAENTIKSDYIWIHDYHLINVAQKLKQIQVSRNCGFYLHIPFPSPDTFLNLPWRKQIINSFLEYDLLGFQTKKDRDNFLHTVQIMLPAVKISSSHNACFQLQNKSKTTQVCFFPISIDFEEFSAQAAEQESSASLQTVKNQQTILGVDRLDYSKGIPERIKAFGQFLKNYPEFRERVSLEQVVVPSRENVAEYKRLKEEIEGLVGQINGQYSSLGWTPIQYIYRNLAREQLVAKYQQADIALITPLRDGMNLVAKEYCACKNSLSGILILSEFTGAATQLSPEALLVNPWDTDNVAQTIFQACTMPQQERRRRMLAARNKIKLQDIYWWLNSFLETSMQVNKNKLRLKRFVSFPTSPAVFQGSKKSEIRGYF